MGCDVANYWVAESARRLFRRRSGSRSERRPSTARCVLSQMGTACASSFLPFGVSDIRRPRRSVGATEILTKARRSKGLRAAVKVVRSIASSVATAAIAGGSGRFNDIISENCPLVSPSGRSASSKRQSPCGSLQMKTEASVANQECGLKRGVRNSWHEGIILISTYIAKLSWKATAWRDHLVLSAEESPQEEIK